MARCTLLFLFLTTAATAADETLAASLPGESRATAGLLEEARAAARMQDWAVTVDRLVEVVERHPDDLVLLTPRRAASARRLAHRDLATLPAAGLAVYRGRAEESAQKWLAEGRKDLDTSRLRRVVDEAFATRAAAAALDLLGDLAFERGDFHEARHWWGQLVPPPGPEDPLRLKHPDAPTNPSRLRAKQLVALHFAGERGRHAVELDAFRKAHPAASGRLAGRDGPYVETLAALFARSKSAPPAEPDWPTFAGDPTRQRIPPGGADPANLLSRLAARGPAWRAHVQRPRLPDGGMRAPSRNAATARSLAFLPAVADGQVLLADTRSLTALDLRTGERTPWYDAQEAIGGLDADLTLPARADLRCGVTVDEGRAFVRFGTPLLAAPGGRGAGQPASYLVCLSLRPDASGRRERWHIPPGSADDTPAVFEGAPLAHDGRVYIAATRFVGGRAVTAIHCYPARAATAPVPLWRQDVCQAAEAGSRARHHLLTLAGENVVYASHSGAVVALDALTGQRSWAVRYPAEKDAVSDEAPPLRDLAPCVYADGRLYAAPADAPRLLCLDPSTGRTLWERERLPIVHLLGVGAGRLILTTPDGLRAVDAVTGDDSWAQPGDGSRLTPYGRGLLVGDVVWWPTIHGVYVVRQDTGEPPDELDPSPLARVPPGHLAIASGALVVATTDEVSAFLPGDPAAAPPPVPKPPPSRPIFGRRPVPMPPLVAPADRPSTFLSRTWQTDLTEGERFLAAHPSGAALLFARPGALVSRTGADGTIRWTRPETFLPRWAASHGDAFLVGRTDSLEALAAADGEPAWRIRAPPLPRDDRGFTSFHLSGSLALTFQDERRLLAVDAGTGEVRWQTRAPEVLARLGPSSAPALASLVPLSWDHYHWSGGFRTERLLEGSGFILLTARGEGRLLDPMTGEVRRSLPGQRLAAGRMPALLDEHHAVLVRDAREVALLDLRTGETRWVHRLPGETLTTYESPTIRAGGGLVLLLAPRNHGATLQRLDAASGKPLWPTEVGVGVDGVTADALAWDGAAVYTAADGALTARDRDTGRRRWRVALEPGSWCLAADGTTVTVVGTPGVVAGFRSPQRTLQWKESSAWAASLIVARYDARDGRLMQRLNFPAVPGSRHPGSSVALALAGRSLLVLQGGRAWRLD